MPKKGRKKGEFKAQQERHKQQQGTYDKLKRLASGEEVWLTIPSGEDSLRCKVAPFSEDSPAFGPMILIRKGAKLYVTSSYSKDGKYYAHGGIFYISQVEELGNIIEVHPRTS